MLKNMAGRRGGGGGGRGENKTGRGWKVEKVEKEPETGDGAPDLTTPTHSGPSLLASCALRLILRGPAHTYIYLTTHAGR